MTAKLTRLLAIAVLTMGLTVGSAMTAVGYIKQSQVQIRLSGPGVVPCNRSAVVSARVVSSQGNKPVRNQIVRWRLAGSQSSRDGLSASTTVTDRNGRTSVRLSFGAVAGPRGVRATASKASSSITVRCAGGLPRTAPLPPDGFVEQPSSVLLPPPTDPLVDTPETLPATAIRVDRLGIDVDLVEGDGVSVPDAAAAHYPGTAWPGQGSNTYLYAHAREGHFLELWQVRTGDLVEVDMADGSVIDYRVSEIRPLVAWDALEYLAPTDGERLTLQTCLTYDDTAPRFIVIAEPVSGV